MCVHRWLLEGKGGDPKRISKAKKAPLDTNVEIVKRKPTVPELLDTALRVAGSENALRLRFQSPGLDNGLESRYGEGSEGASRSDDIDDLQVIFGHVRNPCTLSAFTLPKSGHKPKRSTLVMAAKPIIFNSRKVARTFQLVSSMRKRPKRQPGFLGVPYYLG